MPCIINSVENANLNMSIKSKNLQRMKFFFHLILHKKNLKAQLQVHKLGKTKDNFVSLFPINTK